MGERVLIAEKHAVEIHAEYEAPVLDRRLVQLTEPGCARVGEQAVEPAELVHGRAVEARTGYPRGDRELRARDDGNVLADFERGNLAFVAGRRDQTRGTRVTRGPMSDRAGPIR